MGKVYTWFGSECIEATEDEALHLLTNPNISYVKDTNNDVICFIRSGYHLFVTIFLLRTFYGYTTLKEVDIPKWKEIISKISCITTMP